MLKSLSPLGKTVFSLAALAAALTGVLQGGRWLIATEFVGKQAFASHGEADNQRFTRNEEWQQRQQQALIVTCMVSANGDRRKMELCERIWK